jgi:hypothetical protein
MERGEWLMGGEHLEKTRASSRILKVVALVNNSYAAGVVDGPVRFMS